MSLSLAFLCVCGGRFIDYLSTCRQKKRLELMLRKLTPEKARVTDAMIFCIEHAEASDEIIDFITESLNSTKSAILKKVMSCFSSYFMVCLGPILILENVI